MDQAVRRTQNEGCTGVGRDYVLDGQVPVLDEADEETHAPLPEEAPEVTDTVPSVDHVRNMDHDVEEDAELRGGDDAFDVAQGLDVVVTESPEVAPVAVDVVL